MFLHHWFDFSSQRYLCPIKPRESERPRFWRDSPVHIGIDRHAKDIVIPDPRTNSLPVYAPADGVVTRLVQTNERWGTISEFLPFLNYIAVCTLWGEFWFLGHIARDSCPLRIGGTVARGQIVAYTGVNGFMTDPRHLHMMVGRAARNPQGYRSLRIRWLKNPVYP